MQCSNQSSHSGHYWTANVWNGEKYVQKSVWCSGKV